MRYRYRYRYIQVCVCVWCVYTWLCPILRDPMDCSPPGSSVHGYSRQEYWSELPCPPPRDLFDPRIEPVSPASSALEGRFFTTGGQIYRCRYKDIDKDMDTDTQIKIHGSHPFCPLVLSLNTQKFANGFLSH